jgi:sugar/nucleoside kinase (ribokinase family)
MRKIICIGSAAKDIFYPTKEAKIIDNPGNAEVKQLIAFEYGAKYQIDDRYDAPGGCAANSAQGLARLGIDVACYCRVGNDLEGQWVKENLKNEKVDTSLIQTDNEFRTDLSFILVNENDGDRTIFFNRDANEKLEIENDIEAEWVFVSALNGQWKEHMDDIVDIIEEKNIKLAVNPGQANIKENKEWVAAFISKAQVVILNRDEATEIIGENNDDLKFLIKKLHDLGPKTVVITDGLNGSVASQGQEILFAPAIREKAVDMTGAGDAFGAAFMAAILKDMTLAEALQWGTVNGSNVVKFYGAREGLMSETEITENAKSVKIENIK